MADYGDDADAMVAALRERQDAMQQKTFTKWWNSYLRERDVAVEDLLTDLDDGLRLIDLMEIISGEYVGKFNKKPRVLAQKMENLEIGLNFIIGKQVDIRCGAGDIAEGNKKLILGLSWMLILRFEIQKYSADIQELLKWCKDKTRGYNGCDVQNFTQSFNDGLAFCALIHKHYPDKLDYDNLDHSDVMGNLQLAFRVADEEFNVPQLLDAADLASGQPDEKSVITYVAKLRQAFSDTDARNREEEERRRREEEERARLEALRKKREAELDAAGNQLNDLLPAFLDRQAHEAETDRLKDAFDAGASDLIEWIKEKDADLANKLANIPDDMEAVEAELNALTNDFQNGEKPPKFDDKCDLQDQYNNVNTRRQLEGRGPADYPHPMPEVDGLWDGMEDKEKAYMDALLDKMRTKGKVEPALDRFRRVAAKLRGWSDDNNAYVTGNDLGNSVAAVLANIQIHERFDNDVRLQINTLGWLERLAAPINQLGGAPEKQEVATTLGELHGWYDGKDQWAVARRQELQAELERQRQLEAARLAFDKATQDLLSAVEEAEEYANFPLVDDTEQDIAAVRARMDAVAPRVQTTPEGADGAAAADVLARYQALGGLLDQRVADIRNGVTPDFASPTDDPAYLAYNKTAANFDNWYIRMFKIIMVNPNEKSIRPDELASRVRNVRDGIPEGNAIIARAESDEQAIASKGLTPRPDPGTSIASMRSRVRMMESVCDKGDALVANPPARIDIAGVVRALDVFAGETPGQVETELLGTRVQGENLAYIQGKTNDLGNGSIDYTGFADAHNTAGAGGSGAAIPTYTPAVKASTSTPAASTSSTPAATTPAATTPAPAATTTRTPTTNVTTNPPAAGSVQRVAVADNIEIDGDRQARAISDGVTLYTTQSATPPVTMRYEVEISDYKKMGVKLDFTGSENIAMVVPEGSSTLVADDVVNPYEVKTICVVQQIDPYAPASLSVKTQWTTMEP